MYLEERFKGRFKDDTEWLELFGEVKEEILVNAPVPYDNYVEINAWFDADHTVDHISSCSHTGVIVFIKLAPMVWY